MHPIVDAETTQATGTAGREAALKMSKRNLKAGATLGADKGYDVKEFVGLLRRVTSSRISPGI